MPSEPEARRPWAEAWRSVGVGEGASAPASAADPVEYLRRFSALPGVAKYKSCSIDSMQLQAGMRVLDVGCGLGGDLLSMASRVVGSSSSSSSEAEGQVVGIDSSAELIKLAQQQHEEAEDGHAPAHGSVSLQVADAYRLPFADASFDAVHEGRVLQHLTDPGDATRPVIREMLRVLRPGGRLVVGGPD
jgi:ubiquinone/menaquinone biosynthesis C-methylase UbiE